MDDLSQPYRGKIVDSITTNSPYNHEICSNCNGKGYDIVGVKGVGNSIWNRVCDVCKGSGKP